MGAINQSGGGGGRGQTLTRSFARADSDQQQRRYAEHQEMECLARGILAMLHYAGNKTILQGRQEGSAPCRSIGSRGGESMLHDDVSMVHEKTSGMGGSEWDERYVRLPSLGELNTGLE